MIQEIGVLFLFATSGWLVGATNSTIVWPDLTCSPPDNGVLEIPANRFGTIQCRLETNRTFWVSHWTVGGPAHANKIQVTLYRTGRCVHSDGCNSSVVAVIIPQAFPTDTNQITVSARVTLFTDGSTVRERKVQEKFTIRIVDPVPTGQVEITSSTGEMNCIILDPAANQDGALEVYSEELVTIQCEIEDQEGTQDCVEFWSFGSYQSDLLTNSRCEQSGPCLSRVGFCHSMVATFTPSGNLNITPQARLNVNGRRDFITGKEIRVQIIDRITTTAQTTMNIVIDNPAENTGFVTEISIGSGAVLLVIVLLIILLAGIIIFMKNRVHVAQKDTAREVEANEDKPTPPEVVVVASP